MLRGIVLAIALECCTLLCVYFLALRGVRTGFAVYFAFPVPVDDQ